MLSHRLLILTLVGTLLLSLTPTASAATITEGFENDATFDSTPEETGQYTTTVSSANAFVSTAQPHTGNKSYQFANLGVSGRSSLDFGAPFGCANLDEGFTWWVRLDTLPAASGFNRFFWFSSATTSTTSSHNVEVEISSTGAIALYSAGTSEASALAPFTMPVDTWVDFTLTTDCTNAQSSLGSSVLNFVITAAGSGSITANLQFFNIIGSVSAQNTLWVDDLTWSDGQTPASPDRFCANPGEDNFGYDYVEGVEFDEMPGVGISFADAFLFEGDSSNSEYLAKGYDPGSEAFLVRARLEASNTDFTSSLFRIAFTTGATVLTQGSGGDLTTDLAAASNGQDGGNFDDHVQIVLQENGNAWLAAAYYNVAGAGLTQIPGTVNYGANPNNPTTFQVVVNSGTTALPSSVDGHPIPDIGGNVISLQDGDGNIIFQWQIPAGLFNAEWKDQWFIGKGTGIANAFTYLDDTDQLQDDDSTCLWDLLGTGTRTGSAGLAPGSTIINPPDDGGGGGGLSDLFAPENMDSQLFIGFLLVAGMVFVGVRQGVLGVGLVSFFMLGLGLAFALGWMPMWLILVLFVVSLAAVWFLPKPSGDGV